MLWVVLLPACEVRCELRREEPGAVCAAAGEPGDARARAYQRGTAACRGNVANC